MKTHPAGKLSRFQMISIPCHPQHRIPYHYFRTGLFCLLIVFLSTKPQWCRGADSPSPSSRWPTCNTNASSQKISFVHVSDTHARYNPSPGGSSPMAGIRGFSKQVRRENPYTVFTNAGDDYEKGSIAEELSQGLTTRQVVQAMQYDVRILGNHDFAWGLEELLAFSHDPVALVLASNTKMTNNLHDEQQKQDMDTLIDGQKARLRVALDPEIAIEEEHTRVPGWVDYAELTVGCVKIGFFGLLSKPWNENGEQYDGPFYHDYPELQTDFDHVAITKEIIARHRQDVDLLVLVSHLGIYDDIRLAEETQGVDVILGGHTHTTMTEPLRINNTTIIHTGSHAESLGRLDLDYNLLDRQITGSNFLLIPNREGEIPVDESTDREISRIVSPYQEAIHTDFVRINTRQSKKEMALIAAQAAGETLGSDAAFVNPQSAWKKGSPDGLTQQEILDIFPVEREPAGEPGISSLYLIRGTGADLLQARTSLPDFAYWGPEDIDPTAIYTIVLPKAQALRQQEYFGRQIDFAPPDPAGELWEAVVEFGRNQSGANLALDERTQARRHNLIAAFLQNR